MSNQNPLADEIVQLNILALEHAVETATADRDAARNSNRLLTAELHGVQADYHAVQAERDEWIERWRKGGVLYRQLQAELDSARAAAAEVGQEAERLRSERDLLVAAVQDEHEKLLRLLEERDRLWAAAPHA